MPLMGSSVMGLGRTNNYVEELLVGATHHGQHVAVYSNLIPNSFLIINPFEVDNNGPDR